MMYAHAYRLVLVIYLHICVETDDNTTLIYFSRHFFSVNINIFRDTFFMSKIESPPDYSKNVE